MVVVEHKLYLKVCGSGWTQVVNKYILEYFTDVIVCHLLGVIEKEFESSNWVQKNFAKFPLSSLIRLNFYIVGNKNAFN